MSNIAEARQHSISWLEKSLKTWFVIVFLGQFIFAAYICVQYFIKGILGNTTDWSNSSSGGYVDGDLIGNLNFIIHVVLAMIITIGGPLQLIPSIRNNYPRFHRYSGRVYIASAIIISFAGFYLIWVRGTVGDTLAHVMTSINGAIIIVAAIATVRYAVLRKIDRHNKWAIRLFIAMSGVFFFRVLLNWWLIVSGGVGIDFDSFTGIPLTIIGFCAYIAPQLIIEFYYRTFKSRHKELQRGMTIFTSLLILIFIIGIIGASIIMWWPTILK